MPTETLQAWPCVQCPFCAHRQRHMPQLRSVHAVPARGCTQAHAVKARPVPEHAAPWGPVQEAGRGGGRTEPPATPAPTPPRGSPELLLVWESSFHSSDVCLAFSPFPPPAETHFSPLNRRCTSVERRRPRQLCSRLSSSLPLAQAPSGRLLVRKSY